MQSNCIWIRPKTVFCECGVLCSEARLWLDRLRLPKLGHPLYPSKGPSHFICFCRYYLPTWLYILVLAVLNSLSPICGLQMWLISLLNLLSISRWLWECKKQTHLKSRCGLRLTFPTMVVLSLLETWVMNILAWCCKLYFCWHFQVKGGKCTT